MLQHQQCEERLGPLGKLSPGENKLEGKTFYLDNVKKRPTALLLEAIALLGGGVESFLHRDVSFVVTGSQERLEEKRLAGNKRSEEPRRPVKQQETVLDSCKPRAGTSRPVACGSRGKALLEKAIRNNERLQANNVLANARSWGVSIVHVDDVLCYLKKLNSERVIGKHSRAERTSTKQPSCRVVKAVPLRSPFLKIEDRSRKYKPLHMQSMTFPSLYYSGQFSPFESPPPPRFEKTAQGEKKSRPNSKVKSCSKEKSPNQSPWQPRKKAISFCECCLQPVTNLDEHLQSEQHRAFVLESSNFSALDCLVVQMVPIFDLNPSEQSEEALNRPRAILPNPYNCELEPLTDAETGHEVQALKEQPFSCLPAQDVPPQTKKSSEEPIPIPNPVVISSDIKCPEPDSVAHQSTTPMPILDLAPEVHFPASLQTRLNTQDLSFDPYSLPPVLSPQVFTPDDMEYCCLYSEPPVLSPQNYSNEDQECEMEIMASVSESIPISIFTFPSVAVLNTEELKGSQPEVVLKEPVCLLEQSRPATPNLKKRRRFSSCEHNCKKRTKIEDLTQSESHIITMDEAFCISESATVQKVQLKGNDSLTDRIYLPEGDSLHSPFNISGVGTRWLPASQISSHQPGQDSQQTTPVCIDPALIPDVARLDPSSSDWDCELMSGLGYARNGSPSGRCEPAADNLDQDFIHRPCTWMGDTSYESRLHTALQLPTPAVEPSNFSRTVVQIVEVLH
ncbi:protein chiffon [Corythoichthys intestinalis]|uniref:protein chiffon n=1 Tax=Corythoichthys intestinalis TaxID=161448 RepID=UPI0025A55A34|nr:protein chiffon [Corythoichthys intestinalis]